MTKRVSPESKKDQDKDEIEDDGSSSSEPRKHYTLKVKRPLPQLEETTVVRIKRVRGEIVQACDIYIGRAVTRGGWNLKASKWHNPYTKHNSKDPLEAYRTFVLSNTYLMSCLHELKGKRLGCWCKPAACHGDVLVELVQEHCQ